VQFNFFLLEGVSSILSHILLKVVPCKSFVKKCARMFSVRQNATFKSPFSILSVTKKYLMFDCLGLLLLDSHPFSDISIILLLS